MTSDRDAAAAWSPQSGPLTTPWTDQVDPTQPHPDYPRPQMARDAWLNLNGLWEYALQPKDAPRPAAFDGTILVPFPLESALSGVMRAADDNALWYRRSFTVPHAWQGQRVLLHFGAVDWETTVWLNGQELGSHRGGYDSFSFDITDALADAEAQELVVRVWDPTDVGTQPLGKQRRVPERIWYTPVTGIWQTVWLEPVPQVHITQLRMEPDIDAGTLRLLVHASAQDAVAVQAVAAADGQTVASGSGRAGEWLTLAISDARLWSPDTPFLYDLQVTLNQQQQPVDTVQSYFGMRKISLGADAQGRTRIMLNNQPLFQYGFLDQGFWPDGLYTAPTDEALRYDLEMTRRLGFNMVRKHVKVEPARWYYWTDRLGLLVWQDMPNGDARVRKGEGEITRTPESAAQYETELRRMIDQLRNHPSIVVWVPFNEGWGQFDTARIATWVKQYDPARLVDSASGWNDVGVGDMHDIHVYPGPESPEPEPTRAAVLGEFGGLGLPLAGHTWQDESNWGYRSYASREELTEAYRALIDKLAALIRERGLSAAVYTQTTDVEIEVNGLMTYDRRVLKIDENVLNDVHRALYRA